MNRRWSLGAFRVPLLVAVMSCPAVGSAQSIDTGRGRSEDYARWVGATWVEELGFAAANSLLGGIVAGVASVVGGRDFSDAFAQGAAGGLIAYGGKRLAVSSFEGAGLMGRALHGLGASVASAGDGEVIPTRVLLPIGPVWFELVRNPGDGIDLNGRLDLPTAYWTLYGFFQPGLRFDLRRTLTNGSPIFIASERRLADRAGVARAGVVFVNEGSALEDVLAHEMVHVLQHDMAYALLVKPGDAILGRLGGPLLQKVQSWVHLGATNLVLWPIQEPFGRAAEVEAIFLEVRRW